jgi:hypothetical protein
MIMAVVKYVVKNFAELKQLASREQGLDCFIVLNYGLRTSKHIRTVDGCPNGKTFYVFNLIDDSEFYLTDEEIQNPDVTVIGEALEKGVLIAEN